MNATTKFDAETQVRLKYSDHYGTVSLELGGVADTDLKNSIYEIVGSRDEDAVFSVRIAIEDINRKRGGLAIDADPVFATIGEIAVSASAKRQRRLINKKPVIMVKCDCGHTCSDVVARSASLGTTCPECYDKLSD